MKKILGIDLGVSSIGWALIKENGSENEIIAMGSRIVPLERDESDEFTKGNSISKNQERTIRRTQRKGYYRYVLRRRALTVELKKNGMFDENLFHIPKIQLWGLRSKAVNEQISLTELGRVLYHLNQKRGYKSTRKEENADKKDTEYVAAVKSRYQLLKEEGLTIGQKFYAELLKNPFYRTKQQIYPREAYIEEFDKIMLKQKEFYPDILTNEFIERLRDDIIYFQRKLKSQKGLVSICEYEGFYAKNKNGKEIFTGPKVAHRSNPIFQVEKIWETINNIEIKDKQNNVYPITLEQKQRIFEYLDNNEKLTQTELFKILGIKEKTGWYGNKMTTRGLQGNLTKVWIKKAIQNKELEDKFLAFNLQINTDEKEQAYLIDRKTGEILNSMAKKIISNAIINEPLYQLWHTIYSINEVEECKNALVKKFGFDNSIAERLAMIDFARLGYGNKSVKAIRKILPYLMDGYKLSDASSYAGYNHGFSETAGEIQARKLLDQIPILKKNALRQPVVEKILNQLIHLVNNIIDEKRGWVTREEREKGIFEIHIELARELKMTKEERNEAYEKMRKIEQENEKLKKELEEHGMRATRNNIVKYRLFKEVSNDKINATCIYTGKIFSLADALNGEEIDVEHIIPKSLVFDDSQSNKTLTYRYINQEKGDRTAYDYMASKGEHELKEYIERVDRLYREKLISRAKRDKLLTPAKKIPKDMIERQLRETQYIARKSKEILENISKNVISTTGGITAYLRRLWGYDDILMNLQMNRIKELIDDPFQEGIFEWVEWETEDGQLKRKAVIKNWTKRDDHRHHAIDALVVACTTRSIIQRINTLSAKATKDEIFKEVSERKDEFRESLSLLDKYIILQKKFSTKQVEDKVSEILVSFKPGKKVATFGKRFVIKNGKKVVVQNKILVPRGPLSEESVYGKIKTIEKNKPVKYIFENPHLIFKPYIKKLVEERLNHYNGNVKQALNSLKENPIYLDTEQKVKLEYATCFKEEYVIKYPVTSIKPKDTIYIVDNKARTIIEERLKQYNGNEKEAFKEPVYYNNENKIPINSVRMFTNLNVVEPIRYSQNGEPIAFVKPGSNHHIAIYTDAEGNLVPHLCTFWHAVERKKYNIPVIIEDSNEVWDMILKEKEEHYPDNFIKKLPSPNMKLYMSLQENEMFLIGFPGEEVDIKNTSKKIISKYLYRVQKLSLFDIWFRYNTETQIIDDVSARNQKKYIRISSVSKFVELRPFKVFINNLGEIIY